jgi:hypothetical protein
MGTTLMLNIGNRIGRKTSKAGKDLKPSCLIKENPVPIPPGKYYPVWFAPKIGCLRKGKRQTKYNRYMNRFLSQDTSFALLQHIRHSALPLVYDYEKHRLIISEDTHQVPVLFRLPITLPPPDQLFLQEKKPVNYIILLIQSGNCAMGYFENGINLDHKVFRSYMVRKKQGTSQVKHLKTKGKSRAGSRVRLGETVEFFENINERLQDYFAAHQVHRIALSCSKILIPYLFNSKVATPFDKRDERIFKIPKHIHTPIYEVMMETHKFLLKGELIYEGTHQAMVNAWLGAVHVPQQAQ